MLFYRGEGGTFRSCSMHWGERWGATVFRNCHLSIISFGILASFKDCLSRCVRQDFVFLKFLSCRLSLFDLSSVFFVMSHSDTTACIVVDSAYLPRYRLSSIAMSMGTDWTCGVFALRDFTKIRSSCAFATTSVVTRQSEPREIDGSEQDGVVRPSV